MSDSMYIKVNTRYKRNRKPVSEEKLVSSGRITGKISKRKLDQLLTECRDRNTIPVPSFDLSDPTEVLV